MKRKKLPSLPKLKKRLWKIFSEYIRRRDADENGMVTCISCGVKRDWRELQAGHYLPKSLGLSVYFEPRNVQPQCGKCNLTLQGNQYQYGLALKKKYGESVIDELERLKNITVKYSRADYEELIEKYLAKLIQV